jgi:hypothetical protein
MSAFVISGQLSSKEEDMKLDMRLSSVVGVALVAISVITCGAVTARSQESACTFALTPQDLAFDAGGGVAEITVTASGPECSFTAGSRYPWITVSPAQGKGSGTVRVNVGTNPAQIPRFGFVTIAGKEVRVQLWQPKLSGGW